MNHATRNAPVKIFLLYLVGLVLLVQAHAGRSTHTSTQTLRGSRHLTPPAFQRRRLMQGDPTTETIAPTEGIPTVGVGATEAPTLAPMEQTISTTATTTAVPTAMATTAVPTAVATTAVPTAMATINTVTVSPTTTVVSPLPVNARQLYPFSLWFVGELEEVAFRRDLELFLLTSLQTTIPFLESIALEPGVPVTFGQRRNLQQSMLLGYQGTAVLDTTTTTTDAASSSTTTTNDIQTAQRQVLEESASSGELQTFLNRASTSSQPVTILQVQVSDFAIITMEGVQPTSTTEDQQPMSTTNTTSKNNHNTIIIIVAAAAGALILGALVGYFLLSGPDKNKAPPPPPLPYEDDNNNHNHNNQEQAIKGAITESTSDSDGVISPKSTSSSQSPPDRGMEVIAVVGSKKATATANKNKNKKWGVIDLIQPAKNAKGIESVAQEMPGPPDYYDDTNNSTMMDIYTVGSDEEESMAGFSLATDGDDGELNSTNAPKRMLDAWVKAKAVKNQQEDRSDSPQSMTNKTQLRWFYKDKGQHQPQQPPPPQLNTIKSKKEQYPKARHNLSLDTSVESETVVFVDDDDEVEVVSRMSEGYTSSSSYKEDDYSAAAAVGGGAYTNGGGGGYFSETSDRGGLDPDADDDALLLYGSPSGALGYFYREEERENDFQQQQMDKDRLPPIPKLPVNKNGNDDLSDVPSDERHIDPASEQDLTGFSKVQALENELDGITGTRTVITPSPPKRPTPTSTSTTTRPTPTSTSTTTTRLNISPPEGLEGMSSWEENPEMMEAWIRERRRIKRQSRNRREERKQPPVTMEI